MASNSSRVSGRSVRSSPSLGSIASLRSSGSESSWFSVNSLSSFQVSALDRNHNNRPRPHSLLGSGSRHRLSVNFQNNKSIPQSASSPAISDLVKYKGPSSSKSVDNFRQLPAPMSPEILTSPTSPTSSLPPVFRSSIKRRIKSPEVYETTFTMSTIEEEIENLNQGTNMQP